MASANTQTWSSVPEDYVSCPICLDAFTEPVSTPCGHNFCKGCITPYWASRDSSQCPLCMAEFREAPVLQVNTELKDKLELFKKTKSVAGVKGSPPVADEVFCDLCHGMKRKALKSCLVCLASYCNGHLKPHHSVQALKWHKLINPVKNLEDRMCKKHNKVLEFFCKEDQRCVCVLCLKDHHRMHVVISLDEELKGRKMKVKNAKRDVNQSWSNKHGMIQTIQNSMKQGREELERATAETTTAFNALEALVRTKKMTLIEMLEEKQKEEEQRAKSVIRQLQLEVVEDNRLSDQLEELLEAEDDFRLLQDLPAVPSPSNINYPLTESAQRLLETETVKKAVAKMVEMLDEQMEIITGEVNMVKGQQTKRWFDDELGVIQSQHAVNLALDPDTAHPCLVVSEDRKQVRDAGTKTSVPDNPMRFDSLHYVLGDKGFSSGTFYFEIKLNGQTRWEVGMARESISRKGVNLSLSPENGCWTLGCYWGRYQANSNPPVILALSNKPENIGVFVNYEGGLVSFYDVDTRALIYCFSGCAFTASVPFLRNILSLNVYGGATSKTKIYPLLRPDTEQGSASLQITPV